MRPPSWRTALRPVILRLGRRLRQMRDESVELTASQSSAMGVLLNRGDLTMGELAAEEQVRPPTITRVVKGLEDARPRPAHVRSAGRPAEPGRTDRQGSGHAWRPTGAGGTSGWPSGSAELDADERAPAPAAVPVLAKMNAA